MTKQEEIREGIYKTLNEKEYPNCGFDVNKCANVGDCYRCMTDEILKYLHSQGVVIKGDRELPDSIPALCVVNLVEGRGYPNCMAGYVAAEPLIEEK